MLVGDWGREVESRQRQWHERHARREQLQVQDSRRNVRSERESGGIVVGSREEASRVSFLVRTRPKVRVRTQSVAEHILTRSLADCSGSQEEKLATAETWTSTRDRR